MLPLILLAAALPAPPPVPVENEIVVIARKMRYIRVDIQAPMRNGRLALARCRVTRSSGYAELDAVPCDAARICMESAPATRRMLEQCVEARSQTQLDAIAARWRAARMAGQ